MKNVNWAVQEYYNEKDTYKLLATKTHDLLESILKSEGIYHHSITSREKDPEKLREKITREGKHYDSPLNEITDLAAVRVVAYFPSDIDKIVEIIEKEFNIDKNNSIDKRYSPDPNILGYASVHLVVGFSDERLKLPDYIMFQNMKCEIQVRTILQHAWAEIEHGMVYKSTDEIHFQIQRRFATLAGLLEVADREFESLRQNENDVRKSITISISKKDFDIPIYFYSINSYLEIFHEEKVLKNFRVSLLNKLSKQMGISSIKEFNDILSSNSMSNIDTVLSKGTFSCSPKKIKECLLRYFIAIAIHFEIEMEEIKYLSSCTILEELIEKIKNQQKV